MTLFICVFLQIKVCRMTSWLIGDTWFIAKKQWKIKNTPKTLKHLKYRTSRESLSRIVSAFYNQIFSLLHRAVPLRHLQQYVFIWRWRAQMLLDINIENTMLWTQSGVCALKLFTNALDSVPLALICQFFTDSVIDVFITWPLCCMVCKVIIALCNYVALCRQQTTRKKTIPSNSPERETKVKVFV